jgi:hypothetical protein
MPGLHMEHGTGWFDLSDFLTCNIETVFSIDGH